jgi:hypothetical protein
VSHGARTTKRPSTENASMRSCEFFGCFVEAAIALLAPVARLSAIVGMSDDSAVLRIVLTPYASAKGNAPTTGTSTAAPLTDSGYPQPVVAVSEKSLRAFERSLRKSSFELGRPG